MAERRPRLLLDISAAIDPRPTGVARYIRGLVDGLRTLDPWDLTLYCRASRWRIADPRQSFPELPIVRWYDRLAPRGGDLFHAPDLRLPRRARTPLVVTIHDLSALDRSDHATARFIAKKRARITTALERSTAIITHAASVRRDLIARTGIDPDRVTAVPLWPGLPAPADRRDLPPDSCERRGLLLVGGPSVRKRSERIAELLPRWDAATARNDEPVRWCGSASEEEVHAFLRSLPGEIAARIEWLGHVDDDSLDRELRGARAFVQLSDTEGFGIPLLEAAERSCPVLVRRSETAEEVLPPHAAFWLGGEDESEQLAACARTQERRRRAESAAAIARAHSRARTIERTVAVYRRALTRAAGDRSAASASVGSRLPASPPTRRRSPRTR